MKQFIKDLEDLLDKHNYQVTGQLLISKKEYPHTIKHSKQAMWGAYAVRGKGEIVIGENIPKQAAEKIDKSKNVYVISDDLGMGGVFNHADGKKYDSKSQYYRAVRDAGLEVLGNDAPRDVKPVGPKINENDLKRDIAQAMCQLGA